MLLKYVFFFLFLYCLNFVQNIRAFRKNNSDKYPKFNIMNHRFVNKNPVKKIVSSFEKKRKKNTVQKYCMSHTDKTMFMTPTYYYC